MDSKDNGGLPRTAGGLVRYFEAVWRQHAIPVIETADHRQTLAIPAGPWGPAARVWFGQRWAVWGAITIGPDIFLPGGEVDAGLLAHEYTHVLQTRDAGGFLPYLRKWADFTARHGYHGNPFEVEAFAAPAKLDGLLASFGVAAGGPYGAGDTWHPAWVRNGPRGPELLYGGVAHPARAA